MSTLQQRFLELTGKFTTDENLQRNLWFDLEKKYTNASRHYHNLAHLENMMDELDAVEKQISDFDVILFSVFYHDVIYEASARNNEEKSAAAAKKAMQLLKIETDKISKVENQIVATKAHKRSDPDTNFLLDADLAILGKDLETYSDYADKIRKEYAIYPDFLYNPGRRKVLRHFLELPEIFKTDEFRQKYEKQARLNLATEIGQLN